MQLGLTGLFSYFSTWKPTITKLQEIEYVLVITPYGYNWDPHSDVYVRIEENMLDWEGNMISKKYQVYIMVEDIPGEDNEMVISYFISAAELQLIDKHLS